MQHCINKENKQKGTTLYEDSQQTLSTEQLYEASFLWNESNNMLQMFYF